MTPGRRYFRAANASANPSTACPATIFVTLSAQHGVRSRSWWNCIAMDASKPTLKKHTEVFSTTSTVASSSPLPASLLPPSTLMSSNPSFAKSALPPRLEPRDWFRRRPNPMPLFAGPKAEAPEPKLAPAARDPRRPPARRDARRSECEDASPRDASTELGPFPSGCSNPPNCFGGRCAASFAARVRRSVVGDERWLFEPPPGGVIGGGANASSGRCGRSSLSIATRRAALILRRRLSGLVPA